MLFIWYNLYIFLRVYFDVFRQSSRFNFRQSKQSSFYVFWVFVHSGGGEGTPDKRFPEGLFWRFQTKFPFLFSLIKTEFVLCFWSFCNGRGGSLLTYFDTFPIVIFAHENRVINLCDMRPTWHLLPWLNKNLRKKPIPACSSVGSGKGQFTD